MHSDLMHSAGARFTQHHTGLAVESESLERRGAVLALGRHLAHTNLVADHFDGFGAFDQTTEKCITSIC